MATADVRRVVDLWADQTAELGERYQWVQVFENRGEMMGASNPHPHGQIWAGTALPREAAREDRTQAAWLAAHGRPMLLDYVAQEAGGPRVVVENDDWLAVVPFWASWPYETLLVARSAARRLPELDDRRRDSLADVLIRLLRALRPAVRPVRSRTRWAGTRRRSATVTRRTGSSTPTSCRRS